MTPQTPPLIAGLLQAKSYCHPAVKPQLIETHISWVILAGEFAYKIKKPLDLGFLDFTTLQKRHHFCEEEIRLNRRLAPDIYLGVVAITGTLAHPQVDAQVNPRGHVLEWAVKMRAFPANATLDREAEITREQIDAIANQVADFHASIAIAPQSSLYGEFSAVVAPIMLNFSQLSDLLRLPVSDQNAITLNVLHAWSQCEAERLTAYFTQRKTRGFIRECHGDLHLGNIAWVDDKPLIFDALEFNADLRHIDVINEVAFLSMDLQHRGRSDLAWRFLNHYLDLSGDIAGLAALTFYQVYRAMVRAKVTALLAKAHETPCNECMDYLQLAKHLIHTRHPVLILMHGVSGSGKSWLSQHLLEQLGGIRLRSDVIRKRLFGLKPLDNSRTISENIYSQEASAQTLQQLIHDARIVLANGYLCIIDATFIHRTWRQPFQDLAEEMHIDWHIISLESSEEILRDRIIKRQHIGTDPSEADLSVLASQLAHLQAHQQTFFDEEKSHVITVQIGRTLEETLIHIRSRLASCPNSAL